MITGAAGEPPVFINVNVCAPVFPGSTDPKSYGDGENVRTGGPDAALASLAPNANAVTATHKTKQQRAPANHTPVTPTRPKNILDQLILSSPRSLSRLENTANLPDPRRVRQATSRTKRRCFDRQPAAARGSRDTGSA